MSDRAPPVPPGFTPEVAEAFNAWLESCDGDIPRLASTIFLAGWEARERQLSNELNFFHKLNERQS